jgi:hypothetical protein
MVDALRAAHRVTKRGGIVVDARPDASRPPRILARGRVRGHLRQTADADMRDRRADEAVERVVRRGLFARGRRGYVWYASRFEDLDEFDAYANDSSRYGGMYARGTRRALLPFRRGPLVMRRATKFELLRRL